MKTMPWLKQTTREPTLDRYLKIRRGMIGYLANFHSLRKKRPNVASPNTMRQMTMGEPQGYVTPPYSRPRRNIMVPPTIVMHPSQSIAFNPAKSGVFGVSMSRKKMMMAKAMASIGTKGPAQNNGRRKIRK